MTPPRWPLHRPGAARTAARCRQSPRVAGAARAPPSAVPAATCSVPPSRVTWATVLPTARARPSAVTRCAGVGAVPRPPRLSRGSSSTSTAQSSPRLPDLPPLRRRPRGRSPLSRQPGRRCRSCVLRPGRRSRTDAWWTPRTWRPVARSSQRPIAVPAARGAGVARLEPGKALAVTPAARYWRSMRSFLVAVSSEYGDVTLADTSMARAMLLLGSTSGSQTARPSAFV